MWCKKIQGRQTRLGHRAKGLGLVRETPESFVDCSEWVSIVPSRHAVGSSSGIRGHLRTPNCPLLVAITILGMVSNNFK